MADIQELKGYRDLYFRVQRYSRQIEELRSQLYTMQLTNYEREHVDGGKPSFRRERLIDKLEEIEEEYVDSITSLHNQMRAIEKRVYSLPNPYNEILIRRYCMLEKFEQIALELNYSYRWIQRLHRKGLQKYKEAV